MAENSIQSFAVAALAQRLAEMSQQVALVRSAQPIEAIHQMRVASRRMRAALQIFSDVLPRAKARQWRTQVRRVTRALGEARDMDVQIQFIDERLAQTTDRKLRPGLARLRLRLQQQRDQLQGPVLKAMDRLEASGLFFQMPRDLHSLAVEAQTAGSVDQADEPARFGRNVIAHRLDELLGYQQFVNQPHMAEQLHEMRIATKRLRYTMEIFAECFEGHVDQSIRRVRRLQNQLGDLHDMDVWIARLPAFLEEERQRHLAFHGRLAGFAKLKKGIEALQEYCIGERLKAYEQFFGTWTKLASQKFWPRLRKLLASSPQAQRSADSATEPAPSAAPPPPVELPIAQERSLAAVTEN